MKKTSVFDAHSKNYNSTHDEHLPKGITHDQYRVQKLDWVLNFIPPTASESTILDFGCNAGELCIDLMKSPLSSKLKVIGIDESSDSLKVARENSNQLPQAPQYLTSLQDLDPQQKFDLITVFNVLHHVEPSERESVLKQLHGKLRPKGKLLIWEHNRWNPLTRYLVKICPFDEGVKLVSSRWLRSKLAEQGFQVESFEYVNLIPPSLQSKKPFGFLERAFTGFPVGAQYRLVARPS